MDALRQTYSQLGISDDSTTYVTTVNAGHGFVTDGAGDLCCDPPRFPHRL